MRKIFIICFVLTILATACSKTNKIPLGTYCANEEQATVIVQKDNKMTITGPKEVSAAFTGQYVIVGDRLTLTIAEQEDYIFLIKGKDLVLENGKWLENWVDKGTEFHFIDD